MKKFEMSAGKYFIGDPCYVMDVDDYIMLADEILACHKFDGGEFTVRDGQKIVVLPTKHNHSEYPSNENIFFPVDSGTIACIPIEYLLEPSGVTKKHNLECCGMIKEFPEHFKVSEYDGLLFFGDTIIETDGTYEYE